MPTDTKILWSNKRPFIWYNVYPLSSAIKQLHNKEINMYQEVAFCSISNCTFSYPIDLTFIYFLV